jgi:sugar lactone lactonase YvrE/DNA-binding IclR family transcriptional regulator
MNGRRPAKGDDDRVEDGAADSIVSFGAPLTAALVDDCDGTGDSSGDEAGGSRLGKSPVQGTQALWKGIQILELIAQSPIPPRFTDLLDRSGLPKGTLYRLLQALVDGRLVKFMPANNTYHLGLRLFEMAHQVWADFDLRAAAAPELKRMLALTGETARLALLADGATLYIEQLDPAGQAIRLANSVGGRAPAHASALGKAMLAYLAPEARHRFLAAGALERRTPHTITEPEELKRELDLTEARGYAVSLEELDLGVNAVAAPVLDQKAEPIGAIGIAGPAFRLTPERLHALGREVIEAANRISGNVGEIAMSISVTPRPAAEATPGVHAVIPSSCFIGEGPVWLEKTGRLLWVDVLAPAVLIGNPADGTYRSVPAPEVIGCIVPRRRGGFVAASRSGFKAVDLDSGTFTALVATESDLPSNRFNAGKCDRLGRFWAGSMSLAAAPNKGTLWRLDPDGGAHAMATGIHVSNGLGWSPDDRRFYHTDTPKREIYVYDFDLASGTIENRRVFARVPEDAGFPDGIAVDAEGFVWSAQWDAWRVTRYAPDGRIDRVLHLPVPRPGSLAFGGPGLTTLFITSARARLSAAQLAEAPLSGSVFAFEAGVAGQPTVAFAG